MMTRAEMIRTELNRIREDHELDTDQEINILMAEAMLELNNTMVFIKENTRCLERLR